MNTQSLRAFHHPVPRRDDHHDYSLRVRGTINPIYLWGSGEMSPMTFPNPMLLYIHNDLFGVKITVGTQTNTVSSGGTVAAGPLIPLGQLDPGQLLTIPLQGYSGVYATCAFESNVRCTVRP
jgi:hypothetical protein